MLKFVPSKKHTKDVLWIKTELSNVTVSFVFLMLKLSSEFFYLTFEVFSYLKQVDHIYK